MLKTILAARETLLLVAVLLLLLLVSSRFPAFIEIDNLVKVLTDTSPLIILALGQMLVIVTRCIDLSVAANLALTGMVVAMLNTAAPELPIVFTLLIAVSLGAVLGAINGLLVWRLAIPSIVVTLGTMTIFRGTIFLISDGQWINAHEMSEHFSQFPRGSVAGMPVLAWIAVLVTITAWIFIARTPTGRAFFAVGSNPHASVYTGIDVGRTQCIAFIISGALAGLTGYLWVARYAVAYVDIASGFELEVVAACVIGGIAIAGGQGSVVGVLLGAIFLGVVKNALPVVNISPFWQLAISGAAILIAVAFNSRSSQSRGRLILKEAEQST